MRDRLSLPYASATLLFALSVGFSSPASAGFQWVAPNESPAPATVSAPVTTFAAPAPIVSGPAPVMASPEIISPLVITGSAPTPIPAPVPLPASPPASVKAANDSIVVGFAKSVPLAVALRQILPNGYAFSVDQDVDMGTLVSFQGGRPWRDTLQDALEPVGLAMREQGQMVAVGVARHEVPQAKSNINGPPAGTAPRSLGIVDIPSGELPMIAPAQPMAKTNIAHPVYQSAMQPEMPTMMPSVPVAGTMPVITGPTPIRPSTVRPLAPLSVITPIPEESVRLDPMHDDSGMMQSWNAERGQYLRKILEEWSHRANVEFDWLSEYDYPLQASVSFPGNYENAVRSLLTGFEGAHPQPVAELHANPNMGQLVLVVRTRGNTNSD